MKKLLIVLIFMRFFELNAQNNQIGTWFVYFGNQKINNKWNIQSDFQYRIKQILEQKSQGIVRAGLGYNLTPNNHNVLLGLAYINTQFDDDIVSKATLQEKRVYQQYLYKKNYQDYFTIHRFRLEERFISNDFGLRTRYFISLQKSLNGKLLNKHSIYGSSFNELFVDLRNTKFDRNRFYVGLGYAINKDIRFETGYMVQSQKNISIGQFQLVLYN
ncbi:MAG: hypothetical protein RI940_571, partial [Bacteroidota bacterium]